MARKHMLRAWGLGLSTLLLAAGIATAQDSTSAPSEGTSSSNGGVSAEGTAASGDVTSADKTIISPADPMASSETSNDTPFKRLGSLVPLGMDPGGFRLGPVHLTNVSTSAFYDIATPPGGSSNSIWGTSISSEYVYLRHVNNGLIAVQGNPVVSISNGTAYLNSNASVDFSKQLTARWSINASAQMTFYQNAYLLQNPQYLLAYAANGSVQQNPFAQHTGATFYETNNFSMNYLLNGRTQLAISPIANLTFTDVTGQSTASPYSGILGQLGGGATVTRSFTPNRTAFVSGTIVESLNSISVPGSSGNWTTYNMSAGLTQKFGKSWYFAGSLGASYQGGVSYAGWMPTGSASIMKSFRAGTLSAAYTRSAAAQVLLSSGYFDQIDVAYVTRISSRISTSMGVGSFRSINTGNTERGKRAYGSVSYRWLRNMSWSLGYNFSHQTGTQPSVYLGDTSYFSIGLNWALGRPSAR